MTRKDNRYGLPDEWAKYLSDRGVTPEVAQARGYRYVLQGAAKHGGDFAAAWGFNIKASGLLIPLHGLLNPDAVTLRLDEPKLLPTKRGKPRKFITPHKQKNVLSTSPITRHLLDKEIGKEHVIMIVEGVTRVDALANYGIPAVSMTGVWGWKSGTVIPDFDSIQIKGNKFILCPDGDVLLNTHVKAGTERLAAWLKGKGADARVVALPDGLGIDDWIAAKNFPNTKEGIEDLKEELAKHGTNKVALAPRRSTDPLFDSDAGPWAATPLADARRLLEHTPGKLCVVRTPDYWRLLVEGAGGRWQPDDAAISALHAECALDWQRRVSEASQRGKLPIDDALRATRWSITSARPSGRKEMLGMLSAAYRMMEERGMLPGELTACDASELDADRFSLGAPNGVIDLETGKLLPQQEARKRLVTRSIADPFDPNATHQYADDLFAHLDQRLQDYLSKAFGYALRGNVGRRFYGLCGEKNGGKSTLLVAVSAALGHVQLGGYGMRLDVETLLSTRWSGNKSSHHGNLMGLQDARVCITEEPPRNHTINAALVKDLTGGAPQAFRDVGERTGPARPVMATIFVALNQGQESVLDTTDTALADRVRLLPYPKLVGELHTERTRLAGGDPEVRQAVMAMMVRWAVSAPDRPVDPPMVKQFTEARRQESIGAVGQWLQARIRVTKSYADALSTETLWGVLGAEFKVDDKGCIEGRDRKAILALARELHPDLPRTINRGKKRGMEWRGVSIIAVDADAECSQCGEKWKEKALKDVDARGAACPVCLGVVSAVGVGACVVCGELKELVGIEGDEGVCRDCCQDGGGGEIDPQQFPLGAHLETRLLDIEKAHADSAVGGFPPSALVQQIEGLRALVAAIRANPSIADFPEEQLAVYGGAKRLSETIGYAIQDVAPGRWQQVKDGFDWPGFLLQVRGRAIRLVEQETTKSQQAEERQWLVEQLQPKLDLFSQKQLPGTLTRDQLA